jgi:4-methyl-5(b-hydroxyethyl)-thiazole monophosphate biosynthesis
LHVVADVSLSEVHPEQFDALAVPGGFEQFGFYEEAYRDETSQVIQQFCALSKPVAAICVGALPVAKAGVLQSRRATTYPGQRRSQLAHFGVDVVDAPIVRDGNIVTSTGPGTAVEVALGLLQELTGRENAERIRQAMGFGVQFSAPVTSQ